MVILMLVAFIVVVVYLLNSKLKEYEKIINELQKSNDVWRNSFNLSEKRLQELLITGKSDNSLNNVKKTYVKTIKKSSDK